MREKKAINQVLSESTQFFNKDYREQMYFKYSEENISKINANINITV